MGQRQRETAWVCIAAIATAHGVRGAFKLRCFTERPEDATGYGPVFDRHGKKRFDLTVIGAAKDGLIVKADGVTDRDAALALRGTELFVPREVLPPLDDDEFYLSDLEGLAVTRIDGTPIGVVSKVANYGAGDLLEVKTAAKDELLILPFDRRTVPDIDLDQGLIRIDPPTEMVAAPEPAA